MCGIAGYKSAARRDDAVLSSMVNALFHRGPDAAGYYEHPEYRAGMRRLSINDLKTGDQPLYNEDKTVVLLYNGEIYNSPSLRFALAGKGHAFRTHSDGEVICHLYEEEGEALFERLDGMFAAALWIAPERKLILARDLPGEKPLYYATISEKDVVFASEIKSLVLFPGLDLSLNEQALWDFPTFLWIPEPATVYRSIQTLPRGHLLVADDRGIRVQPYRNLFGRKTETGGGEEAVVERTRRVVTEAVRSRLLSDVPVGSFLSGGLDSSIVATLAAQHLPRLDTFCIAFEDVTDPYHGRADESAAAAAHARRIGSRHHEIRVTAADFRASLEPFCTFGDQPFAVSSGLGVLAVAKAAREAGIKVLLSGDGADECFGGYSWYPYLNHAAGAGTAAGADRTGPVSFQNFGEPLEKRLAVLAGYPEPERAWAWHYYAAESEKAELFSRDRLDGVESSLRYFAAFKRNAPWSAEDFIRHDREFYFPFEMLRKVDRMTMAYSVEGRVPFAAPSVLSHADGLRYADLVRGDTLKWVLRRAFSGLLPADVIERPKHGFNVPIDHWLRGAWSDLLEATFAPGSALSKAGLIHSGSAAVARRMAADPRRLNGHTLFCFVMLNRWLEGSYGNHR